MFAERLKKGQNVFHSTSYRRKGKSCSHIVQFYRPIGADSECCYGDVQTYLHSRNFTFTPFTSLVTTICKYQIEPPNDSVVGVFAETKLLGSHHIPIIGPAESVLTAISCDNIAAKCILVETEEDDVLFGYITPVTDFNCQ
jgi:hypothetical protein